MNKKFRCAIILAIIGALLPNLCTSASESEDIEKLFPYQMRAQVFFHGEFTPDILEYLEGLPPAHALSTLNVLRGSRGDLMLDRTANRMEGAAMLVRLLGAEKEALAGNFSHPFTDVAAWASPYVGYLYQRGLTNGIGNNLYGSEHSINEKSYLAFLLRALGYSDKDGADFTWNTVEQAALNAGLIKTGEKVDGSDSFLRARLAELSWRAMLLNHKTQKVPLLVFLYDQDMIAGDSVEALLQSGGAPLINQWLALLPQMEEAFINHEERIQFTLSEEMAVSDSIKKYLSAVMERAQIKTGVYFMSYSTELWKEWDKYTLYLIPMYANAKSEDAILSEKLDRIIAKIITSDMTDYEKEKSVHDFLITALEYDTSTNVVEDIPQTSFHALGALNTGTAVCNGYAELMALLLNRIGIPCRIVVGTAEGVDHSWNMVCIGGEPYLVDVTWDDPVTNLKGDILRYDYFNLTDDDMARDHSWIMEDYPRCTATAENYFAKNNLVMDSPSALISAVQEAVRNRSANCSFRLKGFGISNSDIQQMMNKISEAEGNVIGSYRFLYDDKTGIIRFESITYQ